MISSCSIDQAHKSTAEMKRTVISNPRSTKFSWWHLKLSQKEWVWQSKLSGSYALILTWLFVRDHEWWLLSMWGWANFMHTSSTSIQVMHGFSVPGLGALLVSLVREHMFLTPSSTSDLFWGRFQFNHSVAVMLYCRRRAEKLQWWNSFAGHDIEDRKTWQVSDLACELALDDR
jgi:hypothetical protein